MTDLMGTTGSAVRGLSSAEAARRLAADGPNTVAAPPPRGVLRRIGRQLTDPLVALLLCAAVVTTVLGDLPDTAIIVLVIVVNTVIGVVQEIRADAAIAALDRLAAPVVRVVRDGGDQLVPAADLVRGDHVTLEAGDVVPADLELTEARRAAFDESALTGESVPVHRAVDETAAGGTVLAAGRAAGTVLRTGADSALGRIASLVAGTRPKPTPLQQRITVLGRVLGGTAVVVSSVVFASGVLAGQPVVRMAITAVSLVVAAVPESLPAVVTLAMALGAHRMARIRAVPRRLHAVETLGSVTVIASDKTGTLTENRMTVQEAVTADGNRWTVVGTGYDPAGRVTATSADAARDRLADLARAVTLCNDASLLPPDGDRPRWTAAGDPMEAALLTFAARCGLAADDTRAAAPRLTEHPFDQAHRHMTTVHRLPGGDTLVVRKGAPETVLDPVADAALVTAAAGLAGDGLRVLAVASATTAGPVDPARPEVPLRAVGLVGIGDPLRHNARDTAEAFERCGVHLLVITGDHPATATAIGARLGLLSPGDHAARGDAGPLTGETIARTRVYARTRPDQKLDIIAALQDRGEVVAMTGDGVNDAPALRRADIGVAMGGGTEVARQAADLVLLDDNLATVATAIGEGRRIYDNIRRFLLYGLSGGVAELMVMLAGPAFGMPLALLPAQLLWINLLTHGVPGVALGAEPAEADVLRRPPRSPRESVLGGGLLRSVLAGSALLAAVTLGGGVVAYRQGLAWQSVMFLILGLAQLGVALAVRAKSSPGTAPGFALPAAVLVCAALQIAGVLVPPLRGLLGTASLPLAAIVACFAVAPLPGLILRAARHRL
ncbi:cation-transporting P-type ATPase [Actinoplanes sp. NBRC 101535]|uniref:cation-translocating P-type ATPase n=1 Tax=Actinoplanes sp. NBRC 101535 TaxID=3032196 RepID=UPI0024A23580|nr:cation-transporting P-type ATPase [Actinoplanes sp. NBRC 101535]GLY08719.1 ATPase [Actinoplanes sp. NBRC 101535]